jgi:RNA polymerase sigma factor (sigma-70 family)
VELSLDLPPDEESIPRSRELVSGEGTALDSMIERERRAALLKALKELPPQMRICCELRYIRGLKYHEIAAVMKVSIETVKAHLHQARKRLQEILNGR